MREQKYLRAIVLRHDSRVLKIDAHHDLPFAALKALDVHLYINKPKSDFEVLYPLAGWEDGKMVFVLDDVLLEQASGYYDYKLISGRDIDGKRKTSKGCVVSKCWLLQAGMLYLECPPIEFHPEDCNRSTGAGIKADGVLEGGCDGQ